MPNHRTRADYDQLAQIASRFGKEADASQRSLDAVCSAMNVLQNGDWVGKGASAFYAKMHSDVLPSLRRLVAALQSAQRTTLAIRAAIQQAEHDAAAVLHDDGAVYDGTSTGSSKLASPERNLSPFGPDSVVTSTSFLPMGRSTISSLQLGPTQRMLVIERIETLLKSNSVMPMTKSSIG